jgi:hypothetical protein
VIFPDSCDFWSILRLLHHFVSPAARKILFLHQLLQIMDRKSNTEKKNREVIGKLFSASDQEVLSVIREIRSSGNAGLIPALISLYGSTPSKSVSLAIVSLVRDLKSQPAVPHLCPALEEINDTAKKRELVAVCWQSGLDFSAHLDTFLRIFIQGDYMTALEAFTVIENSLPYLHDAALLQKHIDWLQEHLPQEGDEKRALSRALLSLMEENLRPAGQP